MDLCPDVFFGGGLITCTGERTFSHDSWGETDRLVVVKVLSDERSTAYATTIQDINKWWLECKECNWYKSKQPILAEARLLVSSSYWLLDNLFTGSLQWLDEYQEVSIQ